MSDKNDIPLGEDFEDKIGDLDLPENLISEEESEEFFRWMMGLTQTPPESMQRILANLSKKINAAMGYIITMNLKRIDHLSKFMSDTEEHLFDADRLIEMDDKEEMLEYYREAGKQMKNSLEWTRKYVYQNKQDLKEANEDADKLKTILMSLPQTKLEILIDFLKKADIDELEDKIKELDTSINSDPDVKDNDVPDKG